jgi:hypothetical protein
VALTATQAAAAITRVLHDTATSVAVPVLDATRIGSVITLKLIEPEVGDQDIAPADISDTIRTFTLTVT